ncbi:GTPase domain-containing protein [Cellulomonas sp. JZ18]|uniref:GTPase domain-containing protein n=1 Tax=Cellulomonas sp. JZ18 TaxID=2654191 RepID=UPI001E3977A6|nr:GTPase domain-containing protein [Cellulomonas sp. JZ18]
MAGASDAGAAPGDAGTPGGGTGTRTGAGTGGLVEALEVLGLRLRQVDLALEGTGVDEARAVRRQVLEQLDDYLLPRLRAEAAPVLAVLGGSTGAGKSTLVNSLLGQEVSSASVLRPTTRWPVLVHHPLDGRWFTTDRVLPGLARLVGGGAAAGGGAGEQGQAGLRLVASDAVPQGLTLLDAPDIDSVVDENRALARQLLGAADLWLFVTTAARYADAVPWELLGTAAQRRVELALVLDRVDPGEEDAVREHLASMLAEHGLAGTPVLVVPEAEPQDGLLPDWAVAPVAEWLTRLAADPAARRGVVERTRDGLVADLVVRAGLVADAADAQEAADARLRAAVEAAYAAALVDVERATSDGRMLRGEVLARWQDVVGTGEFMRSVEERVARWRDRLTAAVRGRRAQEPALAEAIGRSLDAVVLDAAEQAAERAHAAWRADPAGAALLDGLALSRSSARLREDIAAQVRAWQDDVLQLVADEGGDRRTQARALSFGVNGLGAALMLAVFASTGGLTGAEVGIAGGTAVLAQRLLEAVFGDDAVRRLTRTAHERLVARVGALLDAEAARFTAQLDALGTADAGGGALRAAASRVASAPLPGAQGGRTGEPRVAAATSAGAPAGRLRGVGALPPRAAGGPAGSPDAGERTGERERGVRGWWRRLVGGDEDAR